ncbi:RND family transporter [Mycobacteroides salmoniphilum]|uniref:Membrane transport protein mmpL8 n=1 Tax=Mycobacteroides salmoniphilum TaxID=404941 RepID=A0A4R8SMX1_9MYCO|nr:RND family transporter [Mycobacteroides salmoniphilum]TEA00342.1 Membrane transport protein mmpL8 [Mycobacteroides salmoniphilum]
MSGNQSGPVKRPVLARVVRVLALPIILVWLVLTVVVNVVVPQLETVGKENSVSLTPKDAPSVAAMKHMGEKFQEFDSDSSVMIVLEGDHQKLGDEARTYYRGLVQQLRQDTRHVQHVQDYWGERITASGSQSEDGKAAYVQVNLAGNQGETLSAQSVEAVRKIVEDTAPPPGIQVHVTGQAALITDSNEAGDASMITMTIATVIVIAVMLLLIYRSVTTMVLVLFVVLLEMGMARGLIAVLGHFHILGLSTFVVSVLTALAIAAGTDYLIFLLGRYHEARQAGENRETAYYTTIHSVFHVIVGSGLTIAGAMLCLSFTRLNYFNSLGIPCTVGMLVVLAMALTLAPAVLWTASRFGLLEPKRKVKTRGWRRLGTAIVRWPIPILATASTIALVGVLALPGYRTNYNDRHYIPSTVPSNVGYAAAERHFSAARMNPDVLMVEANHDLRNPRDMLVLDRIAKNIFRVKGIARVQSITRPLGPPMEHSSIPFHMSMESISMRENLQFLNARMADMLNLTDQLGTMITIMERMHAMAREMADTTHSMVGTTKHLKATADQMRDNIANFDDQFRPLRNYFYWEKHCFDIPMCWATRSLFDTMDGIDKMTEDMSGMLTDLEHIDQLLPQMVSQLPPMIAIAKNMRATMLTMYSTFSGMLTQMDRMSNTATVMGQIFDDAKNDDFFYLPPDAFDSPDFQRGLALMVSPDGKAARLTITHDVDPATPEGIAHVDAELEAAKEAVKGSPLADAKFYLGGTAATYKDIQQASGYDLLIAAIAAIILIFIVMVLITRALIASLVIVGTVVVSLASSFGLSVLIWQHLLGIELQWIVLAMSVIVLLAVGSDYNLLVVSRLKEELGGGLKTGLIRTMGGTGGVVTAAGLVFAFTMISMVASDLQSIGQIGTTIGLGLLFDTFIVRSLMTPTIAVLLGRWFWWPLKVRSRTAVPPSPPRADLPGSEEPVTTEFPKPA